MVGRPDSTDRTIASCPLRNVSYPKCSFSASDSSIPLLLYPTPSRGTSETGSGGGDAPSTALCSPPSASTR